MIVYVPAEGIPTLLWLDAEFTGPNPEDGHKLLEIAAIVTDLGLRELDSFETFISQDWSHVTAMMQRNNFWRGRDDIVARMKQGLPTGMREVEVEEKLVSLVAENFKDVVPTLAGSSVHNDLIHLRAAMPRFVARLSHQIFDVSSIATFGTLYLDLPEYREKRGRHQAMADIRESIDETRFILKNAGVDLTNLH